MCVCVCRYLISTLAISTRGCTHLSIEADTRSESSVSLSVNKDKSISCLHFLLFQSMNNYFVPIICSVSDKLHIYTHIPVTGTLACKYSSQRTLSSIKLTLLCFDFSEGQRQTYKCTFSGIKFKNSDVQLLFCLQNSK